MTKARASNRDASAEHPARRSMRDGILHAAMELFAKEGSRGTPLAAIAERIGVTAPAITHHFGTKRSLLMEVVEQIDRLDEGRAAHPPDATGIQRLDATRTWARFLLTDPATANLWRLRIVMVAEALDPEFPAHRHFVVRNRRLVGQLVEIIEAGQLDGSVRRDVDPTLVASEVVAFMQGANMQWFLDPDRTPLQAVFDEYFDRLVRDLTPPPSNRRARSSSRTPIRRRRSWAEETDRGAT